MTRRHTRGRIPPRPERPHPAVPPPASLIPALRALIDPRAPWLIPLLLLIATRAVMWLMMPVAAEDAYITFRYARHLAAGNGLVYNPGEPVFGFSSPLWTLWNALGYLLTHNPLLWARASSLAADIATLLVGGALLERRFSRTTASCFTFFFAVWPYFAAVAMSGMENSAMLALIVVAGALVERQSPLAGPILGAVGLIRPEGLACAAVLAWRAPRHAQLSAALVIAAGLGALGWWFGTVIPQSVIAKAQVYGTRGPWVGRYWWDWLSPFFLGRWPVLSEGTHLFVLSIVLAPAVVIGARALWPVRETGLGRAIAACLVVWLGYALLGVTYFWWYLGVPLAGFALLGAIGLPRIVRGRGVFVSALLYLVGMWTIALHLYVGRLQTEFFQFGQVANYLVAHARPGEKVMLEPIGMVGWRAPLVVVDEVGLVSPAVARRRLEGPGWYADVSLREHPDWIVVRRGFLRANVAFAGAGAPFRDPEERARVFSAFSPVAVMDSSAGDQALVVLRRAP